MKKKKIALISALLVMPFAIASLFLLAHYFSVVLSQPHEARVRRDARFSEIGKRVASYLREHSSSPRSIAALQEIGVISRDEMEFLKHNGASYFPRPPDGSRDSVILRIPYAEGVDLVVQLDGYMRKEYAGQGGHGSEE